MAKTKEIIKILMAYKQLLYELNIYEKEAKEINKLIITLKEKEHIEFNKIIKSIRNIEESKKKKPKADVYIIGEIYKNQSSGKSISEEDKKIIEGIDIKMVKYYIDMDESQFQKTIFNNPEKFKSIYYLKLILFIRYGMKFKGNKSRKNIVREACSLINQKKYYDNMESTYQISDK